MKKTLFDKIWDAHVVKKMDNGSDLLFIDRQFIHEVTSPQAFAGLRERGVPVLFPSRVTATADHNVPTRNQHLPVKDEMSAKQIRELEKNCRENGVELFGLGHRYNGIVHVIGPELGLTRPGMTIVCGDSHTSTHGALGTVAFGIGTSQVEQVLATQCLLGEKPKRMRITVSGKLSAGVAAKDVILHIIAALGAAGGNGHFVEYAGNTVDAMSVEERMTICNMSIEMGARGGLIAPDEKTMAYVAGRTFSPPPGDMNEALAYWSSLYTDAGAVFDAEYFFDAEKIVPMITYGTSPAQALPVDGWIPGNAENEKRALDYMHFNAGDRLVGKKIDFVFIGSCTNGRIEDLRAVAGLVAGKKIAESVTAWIVPGSKEVETQARAEGLDRILESAGFEFRQPGCSACLGMNEDKIPGGKYCVSTGNRNFEGRQGPGARTILAAPLTAAAAALYGYIKDVRTILN
ncbi:MAG: 3-isopropylmalate/(R)-2-methylmalate dehydratase large subunit [Bacteroidetes bacterium]|nr:MAG: 3-isopropylmalate/(R)-2-methylmalate dehydratase large subunit [Bacteroidota bacterium]